MSMLAERKVKHKWCLNPRGTTWSNDSSKLGQKMLEKMGWSKGKGLGRNENGVVDHVKVSYKNDSKGMGFKETNDQWTEHDSNFNALLQSLSGEKSKDTTIKMSLEAKSQTSRVRVHYKKFTRGKDLSRCSEKDLASIFGKKSFNSSTVQETVAKEKEEIKESGWYQHGGSMVDYFKKKLPGYGKNNDYVVGSNGVLKKATNSDSESEEKLGFGFSDNKKRKNEDVISDTPKKKKKKGEENEELHGVSNPAFNPLFNGVNVKKHILNTIEEEIEDEESTNRKSKDLKGKTKVKNGESCENDSSSVKKKKKSVKVEESQQSSDSGIENPEEFTSEIKCKKKLKENGVENPNFDIFEEETVSYNKHEVKRKKKKVKIEEENGFDNPNLDTFSTEVISNEKFEVKRKKKKKNEEDQKEISGIENPNFDSFIENDDIQNNEFEVKRKNEEKKKHKKKIEENLDNEEKSKKISGIENPNFDSAQEESNSHNSEFEVKRKKKKPKSGNLQNDIPCFDNPNFNSLKEETASHNNEYEVKRKTNKRKNEVGVDNPYFDNTKEENGCYNNEFEVKRKKRKKKTEENCLVEIKKETEKVEMIKDIEEVEIKNEIEDSSQNEDPIFDLMLNVAVKPVPEKPESSRRKSVRFSDVNEERIIPNKEEIQERNELFDINSKVIENSLKDANSRNLDESIRKISSKIDSLQCQIENDMNKAKVTKTKRSPKTPERKVAKVYTPREKFYGKVGTPDGDNQILPTGETLLRFKYAKFGKTPPYMLKKDLSRAKSSYKHQIKGDIVVAFKNTNLHEIKGYAMENLNK